MSQVELQSQISVTLPRFSSTSSSRPNHVSQIVIRPHETVPKNVSLFQGLLQNTAQILEMANLHRFADEITALSQEIMVLEIAADY